MRVRKSHVVLFIILSLLFLVVVGPAAVTFAASPDEDLPEQPAYQGAVCGDGICDPYFENAGNCPADCGFTPTPVITPTVESTEEVVDIVEVTNEPSEADKPTSTPAPTNTPVPVLIATEPDEAETPTPQPPSRAGLTIADFFPGLVNEACAPITFGDLPANIQGQYYDIAVNDYHAPDDLEVINCTGQLGTTTICFPVREETGLVEAVEGFYSRISMLNCTADDGCEIVPRAGTRVGDRICYDILEEDEVTCSIGCVLAPLAQDASFAPQTSGLNRVIIVGSVVAVVIVIAVALFLLLGGGLFGAADDDDDEEED
jgi:hypothetical protein